MTMPKAAPRSVFAAILTGPWYVLSGWPLRALLACLFGGILSSAILIGIVPMLMFGVTGRQRTAIWSPLLSIEGARLALIDRDLAQRFRQATAVAQADDRLPTRRQLGYVLLLIATGSLATGATSVLLILDGVLLAAPWLIEDGPINVGPWVVQTPAEAWFATGIGVLSLIATAYLVGLLGHGTGQVATLAIGGDRALQREVARLTDSRSSLLQAVEHERGRIESELHDRVQHRLVALAVTLGIAENAYGDDPAGRLAAQAHRDLDVALAELRSVIRGIQPRALTEYGLVAAVADLTGSYPVPVSVDFRDTEAAGRLPAAVEQVAYLVISEALTNVVKHARADAVTITAGRDRSSSWWLVVTDNGVGGAHRSAGRGLDSLAGRVAAIDGTITITSPDRGPTEITMRCPLLQT